MTGIYAQGVEVNSRPMAWLDDTCDYCGGGITGPENSVECDGWTCRPDEDDE